jgi:hypothetical protein
MNDDASKHLASAYGRSRAAVERSLALGASGKSEPVSLIARSLNRTVPMHSRPLGKITET